MHKWHLQAWTTSLHLRGTCYGTCNIKILILNNYVMTGKWMFQGWMTSLFVSGTCQVCNSDIHIYSDFLIGKTTIICYLVALQAGLVYLQHRIYCIVYNNTILENYMTLTIMVPRLLKTTLNFLSKIGKLPLQFA